MYKVLAKFTTKEELIREAMKYLSIENFVQISLGYSQNSKKDIKKIFNEIDNLVLADSDNYILKEYIDHVSSSELINLGIDSFKKKELKKAEILFELASNIILEKFYTGQWGDLNNYIFLLISKAFNFQRQSDKQKLNKTSRSVQDIAKVFYLENKEKGGYTYTKILSFMGDISMQEMKFDMADLYYEQAMFLQKKLNLNLGPKENCYSFFDNVGFCKYSQQLYSEASKYFIQALEFYESNFEFKYTLTKLNTLSHLAICYSKMKRYELMDSYFNESLNFIDSLDVDGLKRSELKFKVLVKHLMTKYNSEGNAKQCVKLLKLADSELEKTKNKKSIKAELKSFEELKLLLK
ncbi:MAG: tetratricopeptide repeat protein [Patescibacteria group bacterium]